MTTDPAPKLDIADDAPAVAGTLQNLLAEISTGVGLADRRYAEIVSEMQQRLATLDALAKTSREKAEEQARLDAEAEAARLAEAEQRRQVEAAQARQEDARAEVERLSRDAERERTTREAAERAARAESERASSHVGPGPISAPPAYPAGVDPFDIIDHEPVVPRDTWMRDTADVFNRQQQSSRQRPSPAPAAARFYAPDTSGPMTDPASSADRSWLEGRFNDIAARISDMMASGPAGQLSERFDTFEDRLGNAIETVTTHASGGASTLKLIESHISDIDGHVDFIRRELSRLDGLEAHIRTLMDGKAGTGTHAAADDASTVSGLAQLSGLLQRLMTERRSTEEHTIAMLDTLQQAMIRVLDRMDALEVERAAAHDDATSAAEDGHPAAMLVGDDGAEPMTSAAELHDQPTADQTSFFVGLDDDIADADFVRALAPASEAAPAGLNASIEQIRDDLRERLVADAVAARQSASRGGRESAASSRKSASALSRILHQRLASVSTKQLAVVALALMIPLNCVFAVMLLSGGSRNAQEMTSAAASPQSETSILGEASNADATEPESLGRISPPGPVAQSVALQTTEPAPPADGTRVELPPAAVGPLTLRHAAANGDPSAQFEVAARLAEGKGINQDFKAAVEWYLRSASRGFAQAQYRLGTHYERGLGVDRDSERARIWYQRAAEQGNVKAMHNLAVLGSSRPDTPDYATAMRWFTEAANYNLPDSQFNLAVLLESGLGTSKDPKMAYVWFSLAARNGDKEAMKRRETVKAELTADALAAADAEVRHFTAKTQVPIINDARVAGEAWKNQPTALN